MISTVGVDRRGFAMLELLVASAAGVLVLLGLSFLYVATVRALDESSSQAALQRVGALTLEEISRRAGEGISGAVVDPTTCVPYDSVTLGIRTLVFAAKAWNNTTSSWDDVTYCYYPGRATGGADGPQGALCQRQINVTQGTSGPCWNLLGSSQPGSTRAPSSTAIRLIQQPVTGTNPFCPRNTTDSTGSPLANGQAVSNGDYCLALSLNNGAPQNGDVAFAITDGLSSMTFTGTISLQNPP